MVLLRINTSDYGEYGVVIHDIYRYMGYFFIFHLIFSFMDCKKGVGFGLSGSLFNEEFLCCSSVLIIGILAYNLIYSNLIRLD